MKSLLTALCLMLSIATHAIGDSLQNVSDTISIEKIAKRNSRWTHFRYKIVLPTKSSGIDNFWSWIINKAAEIETKQYNADSAWTINDYVESQLKSYEIVEPYNRERFLKLNTSGKGIDMDYFNILPKGEALGCIQMYSIMRNSRINGERRIFELSIVYNKTMDKILTVDEIFIPEVADKIKNDFGDYFINLNINNRCVICGYVQQGSTISYNGHIYNYMDQDNVLTEDFKHSICFDKIKEDLINEEKELEFAREKERELEIKEQNKVYEYVHVMPECSLYMKNEMKTFFNNNFHWPDELKKENYKGKFLVSFIVEKDGSISNVQMNDSTYANSSLEKEMERVIKLMPPFKPGRYNNDIVRTRVTHVFSFNQKNPSGIKYKHLVDKEIYIPKKTKEKSGWETFGEIIGNFTRRLI